MQVWHGGVLSRDQVCSRRDEGCYHRRVQTTDGSSGKSYLCIESPCGIAQAFHLLMDFILHSSWRDPLPDGKGNGQLSSAHAERRCFCPAYGITDISNDGRNDGVHLSAVIHPRGKRPV